LAEPRHRAIDAVPFFNLRTSANTLLTSPELNMEILLQLVYSGIALGMIYAVIAFGYQLTFERQTPNFGQGDALMLGAMVVTLVNMGVNTGDAAIVIVFGLLQGRLCRAHRCAPGHQDQKRGSAGSCPPSRWALFSRTLLKTSGAVTT
jgi:hypothetical protein